MEKPIAYCGLDCEKCDARIATVKGDDALREKTAQLWSELNNVPISAEMINCMGCRAEGAKTPFCEFMCEIRKCAESRGFDTCGDCHEADSCDKLSQITADNEEARCNLKIR